MGPLQMSLFIERGLRQDNHLSPFRFTLAMEAIHVVLSKVSRGRIFKGADIGTTHLEVSYLLYVYDAIILCD